SCSTGSGSSKSRARRRPSSGPAAPHWGQAPSSRCAASLRLRKPSPTTPTTSTSRSQQPASTTTAEAAVTGDIVSDIRRTVEAVWRIESARIVATLAKITGDLGLAEDLAQEALVDALAQWPQSGVPHNAGAWL